MTRMMIIAFVGKVSKACSCWNFCSQCIASHAMHLGFETLKPQCIAKQSLLGEQWPAAWHAAAHLQWVRSQRHACLHRLLQGQLEGGCAQQLGKVMSQQTRQQMSRALPGPCLRQLM
jgi:hypothetical protein